MQYVHIIILHTSDSFFWILIIFSSTLIIFWYITSASISYFFPNTITLVPSCIRQSVIILLSSSVVSALPLMISFWLDAGILVNFSASSFTLAIDAEAGRLTLNLFVPEKLELIRIQQSLQSARKWQVHFMK